MLGLLKKLFKSADQPESGANETPSSSRRLWPEGDGRFDEYAKRACEAKGLQSPTAHEEARQALEVALRRVYRAVALDIDGTLTSEASAELDPRMADVVDGLLARGVPVVLITGRGRGSAREAAESLRERSELSDWHFRRLSCLTNNGVWLLTTPPERPFPLLANESRLPGVNALSAEVITGVEAIIKESRLERVDLDGPLQAGQVQVRVDEAYIRAVCATADDRDELVGSLQQLASAGEEDAVFLGMGSYGLRSSIDVCTTHKARALREWAIRFGIPEDRIIRIGDQGGSGGNDRRLLEADCGFSVEELSDDPGFCHPVFDPESWERLKGADATREIIRMSLIFAPLSLSPDVAPERVAPLRQVHRSATLRGRQETRTMNLRLRLQAHLLIGEGSADVARQIDLVADDIFDPRSGGVRMWDWELGELPNDHPACRLLTTSNHPLPGHAPGGLWSMLTDTAVLLRGPAYYYGLARKGSERSAVEYLGLAQRFLAQAPDAIRTLAGESPTLERYKLSLAIQDNIRNITLNASQLAFEWDAARREAGDADAFELWPRVYADLVIPHATQHVDALLDSHRDWPHLLGDYADAIDTIGIAMAEHLLARGESLDSVVPVENIGKWRECDHFLQNLTAVQLGLRGHLVRADPAHQRTVAVGIAYGGQELPALASVLAEKRGDDIKPGLVRLSLYDKSEQAEEVRKGAAGYVEQLTQDLPICVVDEDQDVREGDNAIVMDDNGTTLTTMQCVRDLLLVRGCDVRRAVLVRYPGLNRLAQMGMPDHGYPDPDVLFSFVKGLVAPSPYTRLLSPGEGANPYLDETGVFDKARHRLEQYLMKNGYEFS